MSTLAHLLQLKSSPVAIAFRDAPPAGLERVDAAGPSSCAYWKLAAEGRSFFTAADDHQGCAVGTYTHGLDLPPAKMGELQGLIGVMTGLGYLDGAEVPGIPRRAGGFGVALYGPYPGAPFQPDVVLVRCDARRAMMLAEAVRAAGVGEPMSAMLRPTCAMLPQTLSSGAASLSLACIGNRVYTGLEDGEMYLAIPGAKVAAVEAKLGTIVNANRELEKFHRERREAAARAR
jgi:uncharacterized protein (DUF169 family)